MATIEQRAAALASQQHGNITRAQLRELGLTNRQIDLRLASGWLIRRYRGVFAAGHIPPSPHSRAAAAVLACGPGAVLSHGSAAALWEIEREWRAPIEVTSRERRQHETIRTHRSSALTDADITIHWGIRVTTPARTLLDIAPRHTREELARFTNDLKARRFLRDGDVDELLARTPGRPGAAKLVDHPGYTRSGLEGRFTRFCAERGLPMPHTNAVVCGREVDAYFPEHKLIVELDTAAYHSDPGSFERDRDNDATALARGIRTVRITGHRLDHHPDREERRLRATMSLSGRGAGETEG